MLFWFGQGSFPSLFSFSSLASSLAFNLVVVVDYVDALVDVTIYLLKIRFEDLVDWF